MKHRNICNLLFAYFCVTWLKNYFENSQKYFGAQLNHYVAKNGETLLILIPILQWWVSLNFQVWKWHYLVGSFSTDCINNKNKYLSSSQERAVTLNNKYNKPIMFSMYCSFKRVVCRPRGVYACKKETTKLLIEKYFKIFQ